MSRTLFNSVDYVGNSYNRISGNSLLNLDSIYVKQNDVGGLLDAYTKSETDALLAIQKAKIDANITNISYLQSTSTTTFNENLHQNLTITTNFNNNTAHGLTIASILPTITGNATKLDTNFNNISSNSFLICNLNSTVSTNFHNISSNSHLITQLQAGTFDSNLYYDKTATDNLLDNKLNTSILNNTLIHNITTTSTFKIAEFGNYNNFFEMYNNYFDSYIYGSLTGATMFLNQRGFGDVEINNSSIFQNDKIILNHNTTILSNLQVSGLFSCSSILDITGSDARYVLQSDGLSELITGNTNTINSIITINNSQDTSLSQKLDKLDTNAQSVAGATNFSDNATLHSDLNMLTTGSIICNRFSTTPSPNLGLQMTFQMFTREFNINRDGRMWMSSAGGQWETQIGDANVGRVWVKDRFGLGAVGAVGYVLNCAGQARFTGTAQFVGSNSAISLNNGSYVNFNNNGIEGLYMAHNNFVAVSVGDVSNASNQYMMCDGLVNKTIFNKPVDVLANIWSNGNLTATGDINLSGTDKIVNLVNNTSLNFNDTASIQKYTLVATSSLYLMDDNKITLHIGDDPSVAANAYMLVDGNNTKIFIYKALECQSTFATNSIQTYSGSDININSHLNVNTTNKIIMGDVEISYFETPAVVKRMNFTNTDKDLGVLSFDFGETPDVDITTVTMSCDNLSVFKPSFYYSNIVIDGGTLTTQDVVVSASNKINTRYIDSNAVLRLESSNSIDSYINGTKYLELDDTQFSSFNGFNLSSDRRLKSNIEDVDDDTINMVKNIKVKKI